MSAQELNPKANALANIIGNFVGLGLVFVLAIIFDINPLKEYGWFGGLVHGGWSPANWIMSLFSDTILVKAPIYTNAYKVWWWIGLVLGVWQWVKILLTTIGYIRKYKNN